jgi:hypothetical protein
LDKARQEHVTKGDILGPIKRAPWPGWGLWQYAEAADKKKHPKRYSFNPIDKNFIDFAAVGNFAEWYQACSWDYNLAPGAVLTPPHK